MPMYNLIEYSNNYSKTSGSLWQYYKDISADNNADNIVGLLLLILLNHSNLKQK